MKPTRRELLGSLTAYGFTLSAEQLAPVFVDVAGDAGLHFVNVCGRPYETKHLLETTGSGVAFFDYDQDGWLDIFFVNGTAFDRGEAPPCALFHNNRDGTFTDVTADSGFTRTGWGQGCCVGDFDNDGWDDLFVTYWGQNVLYRNLGKGRFSDVTARAELQLLQLRWNTGCCFLDYDRDGWLDLFIANYIQFEPDMDPGAGGSTYCQLNGKPTICGPRGFNGGSNLLFRNRGDGTFENVTAASGVGKPQAGGGAAFIDKDWRPRGAYGFSAMSADFDDDGWPDIYVACDSAPSLLYRNNHDGTFREMGVDAGCAFNEDGREQGGMGCAAADYDGDGRLDILKTNFSDDTSSLYRNLGGGQFDDATARSGIGSNTRFMGWGCGFADLQNRGWKDIFIANGHIYPDVNKWFAHLHYKDRKIVYRNLGNGRFSEITADCGPGVLAESSARGCAFGDFDNDGAIDVVVNNINDAPSLLRNELTRGGHWVKIKCIGTKSNRSGIGARVIVSAGARTQVDEVLSGGSYLSQNDLRLHFGLGSATLIDRVEIHWPSGKVDTYRDLKPDRVYRATEGHQMV
jgi:hypothetical protein